MPRRQDHRQLNAINRNTQVERGDLVYDCNMWATMLLHFDEKKCEWVGKPINHYGFSRIPPKNVVAIHMDDTLSIRGLQKEARDALAEAKRKLVVRRKLWGSRGGRLRQWAEGLVTRSARALRDIKAERDRRGIVTGKRAVRDVRHLVMKQPLRQAALHGQIQRRGQDRPLSRRIAAQETRERAAFEARQRDREAAHEARRLAKEAEDRRLAREKARRLVAEAEQEKDRRVAAEAEAHRLAVEAETLRGLVEREKAARLAAEAQLHRHAVNVEASPSSSMIARGLGFMRRLFTN